MSEYEFSVEWCRQAAALIEQQAAEIERLRAERDAAVARNDRTYCAYCGHEEAVDGDGSLIAEHIRRCDKHPMRNAQQEIERLQLRVNQLETEAGHLEADLQEKQQEIERLRELLATSDREECCDQVKEQQRQEIERLRSSLRRCWRIASGDGDGLGDMGERCVRILSVTSRAYGRKKTGGDDE